MTDKKPEENLHKDHRKRLMARYERDGFDSFEEHNILELLLFYSIPRADTNPTAHRLIRKFGSLYSVLCAPEEDLTQVDGIGPASARLIRVVGETARAAEIRMLCAEPLITYDHLLRLCVAWLSGRAEDTVALILLDTERHVLDIHPLSDGDAISPAKYTTAMEEAAARFDARHLILMHNHAPGYPTPSGSDIVLTRSIYEDLLKKDIQLLEHIIVSGLDAVPILDQSVGQTVSGYPLAHLEY